MDKEVEERKSHCLQCVKLYNGEVIPRPLGSQLLAEKSGEIVSMDYIKLVAKKTEYQYLY